MSARQLAGAVARREVPVRDVVEAHLRQIARQNPHVNAVVTLDGEMALDEAAAADAAVAAGTASGSIFGLPIAVKDMVETPSMRTTYGSRVFQDHVPDFDALLVERLRAASSRCRRCSTGSH